MATYSELNDLIGTPGDPLVARITGALLVAAAAIVANGASTVLQKDWARRVFEDPTQFRVAALNAVIGTNNTATKAAIMAATDAQVLTAVNAVLPILTG